MKEDFDCFVNNCIYPNASEIFSINLKTTESIKDDCIFVIDTNALLLPFLTGSQSLNAIKKIYGTLKSKKQLIIPGQVAREFANNRPEKLKDIFQQLNRKQSSIQPLNIGAYPLLQDITDYQELLELETIINENIKQYRKLILALIDDVKCWQWDDPVSKMYREIFSSDVILDLPLEKEEVKKTLSYRYLHKIPPGYKDNGKEDDGIGDLLIWLTILEIAKQKKDVIFVSSDEKTDWFHRVENSSLYPRFELVSEFSQASDGKSFHIIKFSSLLKLFDADEKVIKEVVTEEIKLPNLYLTSYDFQKAIYNWLRTKHNEVEVTSTFPDFIVNNGGTHYMAVEVFSLAKDVSFGEVIARCKDFFPKAVASFTQGFERFQIVFIAEDKSTPFHFLKPKLDVVNPDPQRIEIKYGYLSGMTFQEVSPDAISGYF